MISLSLLIVTVPVWPYPASCMGWKLREGDLKNGTYMIDPDGVGGEEPFKVQCLQSSTTEDTMTSITHDRENGFSIRGGPPYLPRQFSNPFPISYVTSASQLAALVGISTECEMQIQINCHHVVMSNSAGWKGSSGAQHLLSDTICPGKDASWLFLSFLKILLLCLCLIIFSFNFVELWQCIILGTSSNPILKIDNSW